MPDSRGAIMQIDGVGFATYGHVPYRLSTLRVAAAAIYCRQVQYITVKRLDLPGPTSQPRDHETTCVIADSEEAVAALASEIPATFRDSADELVRRVAVGCVACFARRKRAAGDGYEVVGYELAQRGIFSALGRRNFAGHDVVFSHWAEVLPQYRGRRIHGLLFAARDAYFRARGATMVVGVCAAKNRASLQALRRDGAVVVGRVKQIALLGHLIVWETPWPRVKHALDRGRRLGAASPARTLDDLDDLAHRHA